MQAIKNGCYGEVAIILTILCGTKPFPHKSQLVFSANESNPGVKKKKNHVLDSQSNKEKVSVTNNLKAYVLRKKILFW